MGEYPDIFPDNFESDILPKDAKALDRKVFRIMKQGKIDRDGFLSTFEEIKLGKMPMPKRGIDINDPGTYSTSCYENYNELQYILKLVMKHHPRPIIVGGVTKGDCGLSQLTRERVLEKVDSLVDWWIFKNALPHNFFRKVDENEE